MKWFFLFLCTLPLGLWAQPDLQLYNQGVKAHNEGDYVTAIQCYEKCLVINPKNKQAQQNIGSAYYNQSISAYNNNNYNQSLQFAESALRYTKSADVYAMIGNNHQRQRNYQEALLDFTHAIEVSEEPAAFYAARSWVYNDLLDNANRLADMEKAAELEPSNADYQFYAGKYKQVMGEEVFKKAIDHYNKAIELRPDFREAYIERGAYHLTFRSFKAALNDLNKAKEMGADVSHLIEAAQFELEQEAEE